jgi:hypothetical protein
LKKLQEPKNRNLRKGQKSGLNQLQILAAPSTDEMERKRISKPLQMPERKEDTSDAKLNDSFEDRIKGFSVAALINRNCNQSSYMMDEDDEFSQP